MGPRVLEFERSFSKYVGAKHAVAVVNGTAALHAALLAADVRPGDEVILPAFRLKAVGILVNVGKDRRSTGKNNRVDRAHKSERGEIYLDVRPGDEVILPSFTFVGAVNSVVLAGATPVFADIDKDTYCLKPESVEECVTRKTKAIIPTDLYGLPSDLKSAVDLAKNKGLIVI